MARVRFNNLLVWGSLSTMLILLAGCAGSQHPVVRTNFVEFTPQQRREIDNAKSYEYCLQTGDLLKIAFADEKKLSPDPVRILPDGAITLVGVDRVEVAGLTVTQADSVITRAYSHQYRDPRISVIVLETLGKRVYVMGEVRNPGLIRIPEGGLGPITAVALAGGFTDDAAKEDAVLVRVTPNGYLVQEINLTDFQHVTAGSLATIQLMPYDVIYIPRTKIGDFAYFSKSVLAGLVQITRIASDVRYFSGGAGRY